MGKVSLINQEVTALMLPHGEILTLFGQKFLVGALLDDITLI
jgi:hypothetical protein